ncbi:MAG: GAF domain-containing protein [Gammaproteobacteria bacterium]|nr:GAF domain-containing protein [Gammaproteobacteria bacterium]
MTNKFPASYYKRVIETLLSQKDEINDLTTPAIVLVDTLKMLSELLHLNRGRIFLWDESVQGLRIKHSYKLSKEEINKGRYEVCEGITGNVFDTGKAALVSNIMLDTDYLGKVTPRHLFEDKQVSYIAVPIEKNSFIYGVLAVETITHYDGDVEANALVLRLVADMFGDIISTYSLCDCDFEYECA